VYYWVGNVQEDAALAQMLQPVVEHFGTPSQRADFYRMDAHSAFRRNRCKATPQMVAAAQRALELLLEAQDQQRIPAAYFALGFNLLWSGDAQATLAPCRTSLHMAEQTGDVSLRARALTYITIALRQCEQVDDAQHMAERSKAVAIELQMHEYIATANANLAWVAWRRGNWTQVTVHGHAALDHWHMLPPGHGSAPFQWTALWPLLAVALHRQELDSAVVHVRALLDPTQQRLPDQLTTLLDHALQAWDNGAPDAALDVLRQSVTVAQQMHYL
jgi:hypothetical protein